MIKRTSGTENWVLWDNKRDPFNNFYHVLLPNASSAEDTSNAGSGGRYVGDFLIIALGQDDCAKNLSEMLATYHKAGFAVFQGNRAR